MKRLAVLMLCLLAAAAFPLYTYADVAGVGLIIAIGLLPYILVAAVVVIAVLILVKYIRKRREERRGDQKAGGDSGE